MNRAWYHKFDLMIILSAFFQKEGKYLAVMSRGDCAGAVCPWGVDLTHSDIQVVSFSKRRLRHCNRCTKPQRIQAETTTAFISTHPN